MSSRGFWLWVKTNIVFDLVFHTVTTSELELGVLEIMSEY